MSGTPHVVELTDTLLMADATFMAPTAFTGKPVTQAVISHKYPDHWGRVAGLKDVTFDTKSRLSEAVSIAVSSLLNFSPSPIEL